jgi:prephenate dehydrogenase
VSGAVPISTLAVVGVGLIGGSIALAARKCGLVRRVIGVGRNAKSLDDARSAGIVDETATDIAAVAPADLVIVCTGVDSIAAYICQAANLCRPGTLLTDAGSTKAEIVRTVEQRLPQGALFVGSHPLAGSEKTGPEHADAGLFEGRLVVLTPTERTDASTCDRIAAFWMALGARIRTVSPEEHDRILALTSHLPHLVASALAGSLPAEWAEFTATGFRDTTRLAASSSSLWSAIFRANKPAVLDAVERFEAQLQRLREALAANNTEALESLLTLGKQIRDSLS